MRRFLAKAKSGDGFTVGVIGGSGMFRASRSRLTTVSHGHGISHRDKLLHLLLFEHLDKLFPARGGTSIGSYVPGKNSFVNGAVPASGELFTLYRTLTEGSDYFSYCFPIHIPEQTDLVLLELSTWIEVCIADRRRQRRAVRAIAIIIVSHSSQTPATP